MSEDTNVPATTRTQLPDARGRIEDLLGAMVNISNSVAEAGGVASSFPFIGINNDGVWAYGQERTQVEEGSHWAIDIRTWQHGYIAWPPATSKERKPLGERMVPANSPLPVLANLPDVGAPYTLQFAFELLCMSGEDAGVMALYKNGSYGAKTIVQDMVEKVRAQAKQDQTKLCPVVVLAIRSYFHQEWKKTIYNPVLQIQKWISFEEYDAFERATAEEEPQEDAAPSAPEPAKVAPQPEPEVKAAATGRGRRAAPEPAPAPQPAPAPRRRTMRAQPGA